MNNSKINQFFTGLAISFTIEILVMSLAVAFIGSGSIPVYMIFEGFGLAVCCAVIGAIFSSDKLSNVTQVIVTFIFSYTAVILFSLMFHWYNLSDGFFQGKWYFILLTLLFTVFYVLTTVISGIYQYRMKKNMNKKLAEYKMRANSEESMYENGKKESYGTNFRRSGSGKKL